MRLKKEKNMHIFFSQNHFPELYPDSQAPCHLGSLLSTKTSTINFLCPSGSLMFSLLIEGCDVNTEHLDVQNMEIFQRYQKERNNLKKVTAPPGITAKECSLRD